METKTGTKASELTTDQAVTEAHARIINGCQLPPLAQDLQLGLTT